MKRELPSLQVFRGIAAVLVLLYHNTYILESMIGKSFAGGIFYPFGAYGVDFFFVLSGFIILYAHYHQLGKGQLPTYFKKRFIRIYPIYWLIVIPLIPMLFLVPSLGAQGTETEISVLIKSVLLLPEPTPPILGVAWTLTHEVFFYLVFGLTLLVLKPKYSMPLMGSWVLISLASFIGIFDFKDFFYVDFLFSKFNLEFILGLAAAFLFINHKPRFAWVLAGTGLILFLLAGVNGELKWFSLDRVITYGFASFLLVLGASRMDVSTRLKRPKLLLYLGDASYSIYLTHYPAIMVVAKVFLILGLDKRLGDNGFMNLTALASLIIGCLFYSILEKPLLKLIRAKTSAKRSEPHNRLQKAN